MSDVVVYDNKGNIFYLQGTRKYKKISALPQEGYIKQDEDWEHV